MDLSIKTPMHMLQVLTGEEVVVHLSTGEKCRGELLAYDELLNVQLHEVHEVREDRERHFDNMIIHGSNIEYLTKCDK